MIRTRIERLQAAEGEHVGSFEGMSSFLAGPRGLRVIVFQEIEVDRPSVEFRGHGSGSVSSWGWERGPGP